MKQTLMVKLVPTNEQCEALLESQETFNAACNYVSNVAFNNKVLESFVFRSLFIKIFVSNLGCRRRWLFVLLPRYPRAIRLIKMLAMSLSHIRQ